MRLLYAWSGRRHFYDIWVTLFGFSGTGAESNVDRWKESMLKELHGLWKNEMSIGGTATQGTKPTKTCFVFKIKRAGDGSIERYK